MTADAQAEHGRESPPLSSLAEAVAWLGLQAGDAAILQDVARSLGSTDPVIGEWIRAEQRLHAYAVQHPLRGTPAHQVRRGAAPRVVRTVWLRSGRVIQMVRRALEEAEVEGWLQHGRAPQEPATIIREILLTPEEREDGFGEVAPLVWRALFEAGTVREA